jgi:hypothetical protein
MCLRDFIPKRLYIDHTIPILISYIRDINPPVPKSIINDLESIPFVNKPTNTILPVSKPLLDFLISLSSQNDDCLESIIFYIFEVDSQWRKSHPIEWIRNLSPNRDRLIEEDPNTGLILSYDDPKWRKNKSIKSKDPKSRSIYRNTTIKQELMEVVWHPDRVQQIITRNPGLHWNHEEQAYTNLDFNSMADIL